MMGIKDAACVCGWGSGRYDLYLPTFVKVQWILFSARPAEIA